MSALELYKLLLQENPKLNKTTVYRNLEKLQIAKSVQSFKLADGICYYEQVQDEHLHFSCDQCKLVECLNEHALFELASNVSNSIARRGLNVRKTDLFLNGLCRNCQVI